MNTYYFVGGPVTGEADAFLRRLAEVGGPPPGWQIYPHASGDGLALHLVASDIEKAILDHLAQFGPIYERGPVVKVIPPETGGAKMQFPPTLVDEGEASGARAS